MNSVFIQKLVNSAKQSKVALCLAVILGILIILIDIVWIGSILYTAATSIYILFGGSVEFTVFEVFTLAVGIICCIVEGVEQSIKRIYTYFK